MPRGALYRALLPIRRRFYETDSDCAASCLLNLPVLAAERLDDSASPLSEVQAQVFSETGQLFSDSVNPQQAIMRFGQVTYRLNTASYVGQQARIYYVVPALISTDSHGVQVQWMSDGKLSGW